MINFDCIQCQYNFYTRSTLMRSVIIICYYGNGKGDKVEYGACVCVCVRGSVLDITHVRIYM